MGERWNPIDFFAPSKSGNIHFSSTVVMSASVVQRALRRDVAHFVSTRRFHTEPRPLKTPEDWADFQLERASYKRLSEYATSIFTAFTHLCLTVDHFSALGSTQTRENTFQPHHGLHRPPPPSQISLSALLASGAHFGHSKSLMNPNFMPYAYGVRAGITVIDLDQTLPLFRRAVQLVRSIAAKDGIILFVGTRPDLRPIVRKAAERIGSQGYHVGEKWLPGTLTNKLEMFGPEVVKNGRVVPDLVIFLNPIPNIHAIRECAIEHVPTIGVIDSNVDPRVVMYPIPANDESTRTAELVAGVLSIAGREGVTIREREKAGQDKLRSRRIAKSYGVPQQ